jgi:2-dehydropantoate 2-reductase
VTAEKTPRILLVGCGGVGGVVAAGLAGAGHDLTVVTGNERIAWVVARDGIEAHLHDGSVRRAKLHAVERMTSAAAGPRPFDVVLLATPPNRAEQAVRDALPFALPGAPFVCFQNGLIEERLAPLVTAERVIGAVVAFGASMQEPGKVEQTSHGGFTIGRIDGSLDPALDQVQAILGAVGEVEVTTNLRGARWSKLAINCAISSLGTIGGDRLGALMRHRFVRRLCLEVMTEVTQVAQKSGVRLEKVSGTLDLEWLALDDEERLLPGSPSLLAKHTVLLAVGAKYRRLRSSMLSAIERGRDPVEFLNGEIVTRGQALGLQVPINDAALQTVQQIGRRQATPGLPLLRQTFDATRIRLREMRLVA